MKLVAAFLLIVSFTGRAQSVIPWEKLLVFPAGPGPMDLQDVVYGRGKFVIAGKEGKLAVGSSTGPFTLLQVAQDSTFRGVDYGDGMFVAVGSGGTVATSSNAIDWHVRRASGGQNLRDVCFGDGRFVMVGDEGAMFTMSATPDAPLQRQVTPVAELIWAVAFGSGTYVALAYNHFLLSSNAVDWVAITNLQGHDSLAYGNGVFMASGGVTGIWASSNGVSWSNILGGFMDGNVAFAGGRFWGLGEEAKMFMQNPTGWTVSEPIMAELYGAAYGGGVFVVVGEEGNILRSPDMRPEITIGRSVGSAYQLKIKNGEGTRYELQSAIDLAGFSWTSNAVFNHRGWGYETALTNVSVAPQRFYRLQVR
jgi:hypothetical protein